MGRQAEDAENPRRIGGSRSLTPAGAPPIFCVESATRERRLPGTPLRKISILPLAVIAAVALQACFDSTGPNLRDVPEEPSEVTVFDFSSSSVRDPSAFDIVSAQTVRIDQSAGWDFLFAVGDDGTPELRPRSQVTDSETDSGLQVSETGFEALGEAPEGGYTTASAVAVEEGDVLAGRSRQAPCRQFMKMEVLSVSIAEGTLTFRHLVNPNCERRNLVPGTRGD